MLIGSIFQPADRRRYLGFLKYEVKELRPYEFLTEKLPHEVDWDLVQEADIRALGGEYEWPPNERSIPWATVRLCPPRSGINGWTYDGSLLRLFQIPDFIPDRQMLREELKTCALCKEETNMIKGDPAEATVGEPDYTLDDRSLLALLCRRCFNVWEYE